ncbi:MAG: IS1595 family transposase [Candidatus Nomurabacteria bacterium]|jgi:transposase|nr:IS1595 family transposase [Candidatus Nomurabacteria bacterium]
MKNRYIERSHISNKKIRQVVRCFCRDYNAKQTSLETDISRPSINKLFHHFRNLIAINSELETPLKGEVEIDESYFGPKRVRGVRGRGAGKKIIVFGLLKRIGDDGVSRVYTQIVPNVTRVTLKQIITDRISGNSTIYSDGFKVYDGLVDWGYKRHYRVNHGNNEFVSEHNPKNHINGIENFWGVAKVRLSKFRGLRSEYFNLHLKECEWRFNNRHNDLYQLMLQYLRNDNRIKVNKRKDDR